MMLITGRIGRAAAVVVAALGFTFSAAATTYAATSPCGSACVDQTPVHQGVGLLGAEHGISLSTATLTHSANSDPAEDW